MIIVLTWKIVETSKVSILYMYIDERERERERERINVHVIMKL